MESELVGRLRAMAEDGISTHAADLCEVSRKLVKDAADRIETLEREVSTLRSACENAMKSCSCNIRGGYQNYEDSHNPGCEWHVCKKALAETGTL